MGECLYKSLVATAAELLNRGIFEYFEEIPILYTGALQSQFPGGRVINRIKL